MPAHRDLTGDELHEPKGVATASAGSVYVADGVGSGAWVDRYSGVVALNQFWLDAKMEDISSPDNRVFFYVPVRSELVSITAILNGVISAADSNLKIFINGQEFPENLTVPFAGSNTGLAHSKDIITNNTLDRGVVVEVRTNGASEGAAAAFVQLGFRAKG